MTRIFTSPRLDLQFGEDVRTVIWATGFRPDFNRLDVPAFDRKGDLKHERGGVETSGLYALGLPYLRRRKSSLIHGAEDDVIEIGAHLGHFPERVVTPQKPPT